MADVIVLLYFILVLFEKFHLEKKCGILTDICEYAGDTESWCDCQNTRVLSVGMREEGVPIFI